jgi:hypothetical protein
MHRIVLSGWDETLERVDLVSPPEHNGRVETQTSVGFEFARALAAKDAERLLELLHPDIEFRGLTPGSNWEADDPQAVLSVLLEEWFEEDDEIEAVELLEGDAFADRERVGYRFRVSNPEGQFLVEQQAYLSEQDGQIAWMRVVCSGYRPASPTA